MRTRYEQTAGACGDDIQGCRSGVPPRRRRVWAALARTATAFAWSTILDYAVDPKHQLLAYRLPNIPTTHLVFVVAARGSGRDPRLIFAGQDYDFEGEGYFEICDFDQLAPPAVVQ